MRRQNGQIRPRYLENRTSAHAEESRKAVEYAVNHDALKHLLGVASGLESMVIGEDQVINQVLERLP